jgi:uncharacterized protein YqhQ
MGRSALAERPSCGDPAWVHDADVLAVLAEADAAPALPRLGGLARPHGVVIVTERVWCFSRLDGSVVTSGRMPRPSPIVERLPLLRGLAKLGAALAPLFAPNGTARPAERVVLLAALLAPLGVALAPISSTYRSVVFAVSAVALMAWILRGRTLRLHGAEHRAIAAAETSSLVDTWHGVVRPSRFSLRCGTNFTAILIPVSLLLERAWILPTSALLTPVFVTVAAVTLTMEIWLVAQRRLSSFGRLVMLPGLLLQRLTTREPDLHDTRVALRAVAAVLVEHRNRA